MEEAPSQRDKARASESPRARSSAIVQSGAATPVNGREQAERNFKDGCGNGGREGGSSLYECVRVMMIESEVNG